MEVDGQANEPLSTVSTGKKVLLGQEALEFPVKGKSYNMPISKSTHCFCLR